MNYMKIFGRGMVCLNEIGLHLASLSNGIRLFYSHVKYLNQCWLDLNSYEMKMVCILFFPSYVIWRESNGKKDLKQKNFYEIVACDHSRFLFNDIIYQM